MTETTPPVVELPPAPPVARTAAKKSARKSTRTSMKKSKQHFPTADEMEFNAGLDSGGLKLIVVDPLENVDYKFATDDPASMSKRNGQGFQPIQNDQNPASDTESSITEFHSGTNAHGGAQKLVLMGRHISLKERSDELKARQRELNEQMVSDPKRDRGVTEEDRGSLHSKLVRSRS